jgi:hypothetical protein
MTFLLNMNKSPNQLFHQKHHLLVLIQKQTCQIGSFLNCSKNFKSLENNNKDKDKLKLILFILNLQQFVLNVWGKVIQLIIVIKIIIKGTIDQVEFNVLIASNLDILPENVHKKELNVGIAVNLAITLINVTFIDLFIIKFNKLNFFFHQIKKLNFLKIQRLEV